MLASKPNFGALLQEQAFLDVHTKTQGKKQQDFTKTQGEFSSKTAKTQCISRGFALDGKTFKVLKVYEGM